MSISHGPNSIAAGQRSCAAMAIDDGDVKFGFIPDVFGAAKFKRPPGFMISATALAAFSRTSLYKFTSFCVTPGASGCISTD